MTASPKLLDQARRGSAEHLDHAGRHGGARRVVAGPVGARRLPDQLGEAAAERPQRRRAHRHAHLGDGQVTAAQQRHRALDPAGHQVAVRRLAVGLPELPREVRRRHQRGPRHRRHVQGRRVVPVHQVAGPAQVRELLRGHRPSMAPAGGTRSPGSPGVSPRTGDPARLPWQRDRDLGPVGDRRAAGRDPASPGHPGGGTGGRGPARHRSDAARRGGSSRSSRRPTRCPSRSTCAGPRTAGAVAGAGRGGRARGCGGCGRAVDLSAAPRWLCRTSGRPAAAGAVPAARWTRRRPRPTRSSGAAADRSSGRRHGGRCGAAGCRRRPSWPWPHWCCCPVWCWTWRATAPSACRAPCSSCSPPRACRCCCAPGRSRSGRCCRLCCSPRAATTIAWRSGLNQGTRQIGLDVGTTMAVNAPLLFAGTAVAVAVVAGRLVVRLARR